MAKMEWIAVVDGKVLEIGGKRAVQAMLKKYPHATTEAVQVDKGQYGFGDQYRNAGAVEPRAVEGEVLPPDVTQEQEVTPKGNRMARGTRRTRRNADAEQGDTAVMDRPETAAIEDRRSEEQVADFDLDENANPEGGNKPDGSDSKGPKKGKRKPWEAGGSEAEYLAKQAEKLRDLGEELAEQAELREAATKTRETWIEYGDILANARRAIKSNNLFNEWLKAENLEAYADRNSRTDAMWLADLPEGVLEQVPDTLHSPKAIRDWYRKRVASIAEYLNSIEGTLAEQLAALDKDDPATAAMARAIEEHEDRIKREEEKRTLRQAIDKESKKKPRLSFENLTVEAAAQWIIDKILTHPDAEEIGEMLVTAIEEEQVLAPTEGDVGDADADENAEDGDAEYEGEAEDA